MRVPSPLTRPHSQAESKPPSQYRDNLAWDSKAEMNYRTLGNTEIKVSELALGTWQFRGGVEALRAGIDLGATFLDTAESYGCEDVVGEAIAGRREQIFLASKVSPRHFRAADLIRAAEGSLKRLKTDRIDLYQLHWPNYTVPLAETMAAMEKLVDSGKVRYIGLSNFSSAETQEAQALLGETRLVSNQVRYSVLDRTIEAELLPYCQAQQISVLAFSPLGNGMARLRACDPEDVLGAVAAAEGKTRAQVALQWCLAQPSVIVIFKADKVEHVRENCAASEGRLLPEHKQRLDVEIRAKSRNRVERFARRLARRISQYAGRNLCA